MKKPKITKRKITEIFPEESEERGYLDFKSRLDLMQDLGINCSVKTFDGRWEIHYEEEIPSLVDSR
jgi:hypothetical protein